MKTVEEEKKSKEIVNQCPLLHFDFRLNSKALAVFKTWPAFTSMKSLRRFNETSDANERTSERGDKLLMITIFDVVHDFSLDADDQNLSKKRIDR